ncbi:MAG TPA: branched-chain amino acid ABC transporter ATP-binding protein/permease [Candidatus Limnocylindrales bacterium]|nr:branched-chain amino acid ABC transporter ATP-binding protein/permease [Candidatus Limnocylindrales bacterium]
MNRRALAVLVVAFVILAALPFVRDAIGFPVFYLVFLAAVWFWAAEATSWNILSGYSGYFSFGQAAFVGVGAYTTAVLVGRHDWPFFATVPVAAILSTLLGLGIGGLAFRLRSLRGEIFALLTLAVPFILASLARIVPAIDGGQGIIVPTPDISKAFGGFQEMLYLFSLVIAFAAIVTAYVMQRTRIGWALFAIHDAEDVAEGLGVPTFRNKMIAIGLSGLFGGLGGSVYALQIGFVTVESVFGLTIPLFVIVMSILGGRSHWLGPTIGAIVIVTLQDRLASTGFEGWSLMILGFVLASLVVLAPNGLVSRILDRAALVLIALAVPIVALTASGWADSLVDAVAIGMVAAAIAAFVPLPHRKVAPPIEAAPTSHAPVADVASVPISSPDPAAAPSLASAPAAAPAVAPAAPGSQLVPVIECLDVVKQYGGVRAVAGVSLSIAAGELVGLVGPNGSGKSTLIGMIAGAIRPTSGTIRIAGVDAATAPPHRIAHLGVARTYQIPRPFPSMTVRDNVAIAAMFGRHADDLDTARAKAEEVLWLVDLGRRADAHPAGINLHERQLLEMARALATEPRVLLLDEALAGLNPAEIDQAVEVVRRIHATGVTIVIVEHLLRVVNQLAGRIIVLEQGRLLASGEPATVMSNPDVIRAYLGAHANA